MTGSTASEGGSAEEDAEAYFVQDGNVLVPNPLARSYWGPILHGRYIGGLCARAVDRQRGADHDLRCARLTVELFRPAALAPVSVSSHVIRDGRRIRVVEVTIEQEGKAVGQGKAVLLRASKQPPGQLPSTTPWNAPDPSETPRATIAAIGARDGWYPPCEVRQVPVTDGYRGRRGDMWLRDYRQLVEGEPLTPLVRVGLAGDMASPIAHTADIGLAFVNADYTMYLGRELEGEHIGLEYAGHVSRDGVAVGDCRLHDTAGPLGFVSVAALATLD